MQPRARASATTSSSCVALSTQPVGLCGKFITIAAVVGRSSLRSSATSKCRRPAASRVGSQCDTSQPMVCAMLYRLW